jgi:hypothetical protein
MRMRATIVAVEWLSTSVNVLADFLSRNPWHAAADWTVSRAIFARLSARWGPRSLDLLASPASAQTDAFVSAAPFPEAMSWDAFSVDWSAHRCWCVPPLGLLPRVVAHLVELRRNRRPLDLILIAPCWENQWWYGRLRSLAVDSLHLGEATAVVERLEGTELEKNPTWSFQAFYVTTPSSA